MILNIKPQKNFLKKSYKTLDIHCQKCYNNKCQEKYEWWNRYIQFDIRYSKTKRGYKFYTSEW